MSVLKDTEDTVSSPAIRIDKFMPFTQRGSHVLGFCDITVNDIVMKGIMVQEIPASISGRDRVIDIRFPNRQMKNGSMKKIAYPATPDLYMRIKYAILKYYLEEVEGERIRRNYRRRPVARS